MRKLKILPSYVHDAGFLARLLETINQDATMQVEWKRETVQLIQKLILQFLAAEELNNKV